MTDDATESKPPEARDERTKAILGATLHAELRRLASAQLAGERRDHTLRATDLVHEAWKRLDGRPNTVASPQFKAIAAAEMRRILVDHARARAALKRGAGRDRLTLGEEVAGGSGGSGVDLVMILDTLDNLEALSPRQAKVAELRIFGELSVAEVAEVLGIGARTVEREWTLARSWLRRAWGS